MPRRKPLSPFPAGAHASTRALSAAPEAGRRYPTFLEGRALPGVAAYADALRAIALACGAASLAACGSPTCASSATEEAQVHLSIALDLVKELEIKAAGTQVAYGFGLPHPAPAPVAVLGRIRSVAPPSVPVAAVAPTEGEEPSPKEALPSE